MKPHKHAELIKAWADGAEIEVYQPAFGRWEEAEPAWHTSFEYRIKPETKPDVVMYSRVLSVQEHKDGGYYAWVSNAYTEMPSCKADNLKLTFDGKTGNLKSAEVLK
ncbi:hypothetical protein [Flavobacterium sp.]|jgi:hypothetical protein|uniref:hypothetical protein n=1 Tax=Flavobacterium sp. TaxID=239 RepID=UPI0037BFA9F2